MNAFDLVVVAVAAVVIVMGFRAGLLRSLATILGYLIAAPIAVAVAPGLATLASDHPAVPADATWLLPGIAFVAVGMIISTLLRVVLDEFIGADIDVFDRVAGAALGAVRIALIAVLMVVIFDRIILADSQPRFLAESRLRPYLSAAGAKGLQSLPPDIADYIDRLKRERGM